MLFRRWWTIPTEKPKIPAVSTIRMKQNQDGSTLRWPVVRQLMDKDVLGLGADAASSRSDTLQARTSNADRVVESVCPYCAVGCGQLV